MLRHQLFKIKFLYDGKIFKKAQEKIEEVMHEFKTGTLKSGKDGKGGKVKSRKQAIGISEAREEGYKVPEKKSQK